jgi:lysozyme
LLLEDVAYAEHAVEHLVTVPLTQGQFDALVSFTYEFIKWVFGGGVKLPGLVTRRSAEAAMFKT